MLCPLLLLVYFLLFDDTLQSSDLALQFKHLLWRCACPDPRFLCLPLLHFVLHSLSSLGSETIGLGVRLVWVSRLHALVCSPAICGSITPEGGPGVLPSWPLWSTTLWPFYDEVRCERLCRKELPCREGNKAWRLPDRFHRRCLCQPLDLLRRCPLLFHSR